MKGLMTLADLPDLTAGKRPRSTIVVARLDDRLTDPRYGRFQISQSDVDDWKRNLAETFGGRVAIDADHSSDRGGGTRAVGWITSIGQDGKLITADVEWTPRGAKAIRNGDYRHISPTFVANYSDEHGEKHGKALIGAALTNRPVLRKGMPMLSLSRDSVDGVATPRQPKQNGRAMSTKTVSNKELKRLSRSTSKAEISRALATLSPEEARKMTRMTLSRTGPALARSTHAAPGSVDSVITLAQFAPAGVQHAGTVDWEPPATGAGRVPLGLDDSGKALHALIVRHAASTGQPYFHAMADVTGITSYRDLYDAPTSPGLPPGSLDPERDVPAAPARRSVASMASLRAPLCHRPGDRPARLGLPAAGALARRAERGLRRRRPARLPQGQPPPQRQDDQ
jgi:Mu-like prophage I protein